MYETMKVLTTIEIISRRVLACKLLTCPIPYATLTLSSLGLLYKRTIGSRDGHKLIYA